MSTTTSSKPTLPEPAPDASSPPHHGIPAEHPPVRSPYKVRDLGSPALTEVWLVSAVVSLLSIRLYLQLTGYPQIGNSTLHIAHML